MNEIGKIGAEKIQQDDSKRGRNVKRHKNKFVSAGIFLINIKASGQGNKAEETDEKTDYCGGSGNGELGIHYFYLANDIL